MPSADSWNNCLGRVEHRVIGRRTPGAGGREHQQAGELGRHVTQVFKMRTSGEDVGDREVVERVVHGKTDWHAQKTRRPKAAALCRLSPDALNPCRDCLPLEVDLHAELPEPRLQHARRRQPRARASRDRRAERLVVAQNRRRVQDVVQIEPDIGPRPAELQDLREADIELVDAIAVQRARLDEVDRRVRRAFGRRPRLRENRSPRGVRVRDRPVRRQRRALVAAERAGEEHVDLRNRVRPEAGVAGDEACGRVAPRIGRVLRGEHGVLRSPRADLAVVSALRPGADAALEHEAVARPRAEVDEEAVVDLRVPAAGVAGKLRHVVRQRRNVGVGVIQKAARLARRIAQAGVRRGHDCERLEVASRLQHVVVPREVVQPAAVVADLDRDARQHLLLDRGAEAPVAGPHAPALAKRWIEIAGEDVLPEGRIGNCGTFVVQPTIQEIAVRDEVLVRVGPDARRRPLQPAARPQCAVRQPVLCRLEVPAGIQLQRGLAIAEDIDGGAASRRDVVIRMDAIGERIVDGCRQEANGADSDRGEVAPGAIVAKSALQRDAAECFLVLPVEGIVADTLLSREGIDVFGDLVRHAAVEAVGRELVVGVGVLVVVQIAALIAELHALRAGHVRGRSSPRHRALQILRYVPERYCRPGMLPKFAQSAFVHCSVTPTSCVKLLPGCSVPPHWLQYVPKPASRSSRFVIGELHVACCTRWPKPLRYVPISGAVVAEHGGLEAPGAPQMISPAPDWRHPSVDPSNARALTGNLLVPEEVELVARRRLHRQAQRGVSPAARGHRRPRLVRDVRPLRRIAHVRVREHARDRAVAAFVAELQEEPHLVLLDRTADADVVIPELVELARCRQTGRLQCVGVVVADHPLVTLEA